MVVGCVCVEGGGGGVAAFQDAHLELTCKLWLGLRIAYRATCPVARTLQDFRPRLREVVDMMRSKVQQGAQHHKHPSVVLGNFACNAKRKP